MNAPMQMKTLKTILSEASENTDPYEFYADAERVGDISLRTFFRACAAGDGLSYDGAAEVLRENYQRAGLNHLSPV